MNKVEEQVSRLQEVRTQAFAASRREDVPEDVREVLRYVAKDADAVLAWLYDMQEAAGVAMPSLRRLAEQANEFVRAAGMVSDV